MTDRMIVVDEVLRVIYLVMPPGHPVASQADRARDVNRGGRLSLGQAHEIAHRLSTACTVGDPVASLDALKTARAHYQHALDRLDVQEQRGVSLYRWDPPLDGPPPVFRLPPDPATLTPAGLPQRTPRPPTGATS